MGRGLPHRLPHDLGNGRAGGRRTGRPDQLRTAHLETLRTPALICQGTRDPFGTREEVAGYRLAPAIEIAWFEDGDHDLRPRKAVTGLTAAARRQALAERVRAWTAALGENYRR